MKSVYIISWTEGGLGYSIKTMDKEVARAIYENLRPGIEKKSEKRVLHYFKKNE